MYITSANQAVIHLFNGTIVFILSTANLLEIYSTEWDDSCLSNLMCDAIL